MTPRLAAIAAGLLAGWLTGGSRPAVAGPIGPSAKPARGPAVNLPVELDRVPAKLRDQVRKVLASPTLSARSPVEEFTAHAPLYEWLLDHPDRVALAWRRAGVSAVEIVDRGNGKFGWTDGQGSDLTWETVASGGAGRIWYAEGHAKAGKLLPTISVKAVAVLRHSARTDAEGRSVIRHSVELFLQTDSKAASLVARLIGPSAPRLAEEGAEQLLLFFSAMAHYLESHPERSDILYANRSGTR